MIPATVAAHEVVPILGHTKNEVQVSLVQYAKRVQHFVFDRLDHAFDESLQVWRPVWRYFDFAS